MLSVKKLSFTYSKKTVLANINFSVSNGEHIALMGESGCGKSTLLKALYGLFDIEVGSVSYKEERLRGPKFNLVPGHPFMKYLSQDLDIMPYTSVTDNVGDFLSNFYPLKKKKRISELLEVVGMENYASTHVRYLSGGQKQRVALARVLALEPEVLLLDEPFSQIDNFKKHQLRYQLFKYVKEQNITCITATHDKDDVLPFADKVLILKDGKQKSFISPIETYTNPKDAYTASLFSEINLISEKALQISSSERKVIVYPNQIEIVEEGQYLANVEACFFRGGYYLIHLNFNTNKIVSESKLPFKKGDKVRFDVRLFQE